MKTIKVVAAIILHDNLIFATQRGYGDFAGEAVCGGLRLYDDGHHHRRGAGALFRRAGL